MSLTRRGFLGAAGGVLGTGVLASCTKQLPRYLIPYAIPPDDSIPGVARHVRTVCRECEAGCGATARVREGHAVKLDGNPEDPIGRGTLCPRGQAAIESLYSPDRVGTPRAGDKAIAWDEADKLLAAGLKQCLDSKKLVVMMTRPERGQLGALFGAWLGALGQSPTQIVTFDGMDRPWLREGQARAFGPGLTAVPDLTAAKLILSIGDDFVEEGSPVEHARALADQRASGGRFIYVGPRLSLTAAAADEWISVEPGTEGLFVLGVLREVIDRLGEPAGSIAALRVRLEPFDVATVSGRTGAGPTDLRKLAAALVTARPSLCLGPGRVAAGADSSAVAEAISVLNAVLGNVGQTLRFVAAPQTIAPSMDLVELTRRATAGEVGALILHHADPLGYGAVHAGFADAMAHIPFVASFTNELNETARKSQLVLADHHFLESWSDVPTRPGRLGIQQPVMEPALGTRAAADELLVAARLLGKGGGLPTSTFGETLRKTLQPTEIEHGLRLEDLPAVVPQLSPVALATLPSVGAPPPSATGTPLVVAPSFRQLDGRVSRSALLQEIPDPLSGFSWTSWVELHPTTAATLGVSTEDVVAIQGPGGSCELPAFVTDTMREGACAVPVGDATAVLAGGGFVGGGARVTLRNTGARVERAHRAHPETEGAEGRKPLVRTLDRTAPALPVVAPNPTMYPEVQHPVHRWALSVDLDRCNGCGACTAACYVENNLAVVGAEEVARGRSMSWIPIKAEVDRSHGKPEVGFLPLSCQHCAAAPCESVCPTFATYHTKEGLNTQVYARCVGTRYCENNCPYGVRRFNFFDSDRTPLQKLGVNPDVTVRERGVTEKCTLCNHRIRAGEEQAKVEGRPVRDGEIVSACAAACPTKAIVFGDVKDPESEIARRSKDGRAYKLLEELNTQPGVFYLARRRGDAS